MLHIARYPGTASTDLIARLPDGPLHFYHLAKMRPETTNATLTVMAATFVVGLVFAFIFHRTRNIWLVGLMHDIGNAFMNTTGPASA